ncbi:MAG: hypothetical protein R3C14_18070 [Caldilineaceae bacterium]
MMRMTLLLSLLLMIGCAPAQLATLATAEPTAEPPLPTAAEASAGDRPTVDEAVVTELTFAGNGETFLARIEEAIQQNGEPKSHRYLELQRGDRLWQGELLIYAAGPQFFLQVAQSGGGHGVQITIPTTAAEATLLAKIPLPEVSDPLLTSPHPEIRFVRARRTGENTWSFDVTLTYPDSGWEDYADGWQVATPEGGILATRILLHPHETEQPFTRGLSGVVIPANVTTVVIRSHDLVSGYSPDTLTLDLSKTSNEDKYEVVRE